MFNGVGFLFLFHLCQNDLYFIFTYHLGCEQWQTYDLGTNFLHQLGLVIKLADCHLFSLIQYVLFSCWPHDSGCCQSKQ